jgi:hypothetical protein
VAIDQPDSLIIEAGDLNSSKKSWHSMNSENPGPFLPFDCINHFFMFRCVVDEIIVQV